MRPHRVLAAVLCIQLAATCALAQGVGINGTGAPADTSAILDLSSSAKGFLAPRMTALQRAAIVLPATGLLVYQTDGTAGLYYNSGTPGAPAWQVVGSGASSPQWSVSGSDLYYMAGKVGIGSTPVSNFGLTIIDPLNGLRVQTNTAGGSLASFGGVGTFGVDASGVIGGRFMILENGNVGIGNPAPTNKLSFAPVLGKKITLFPAGSGDYGFGIASGRLQIYSEVAGNDVAIGSDAAGVFTERFAVKNNGALALSGFTGGVGQVLQSNGGGAAATWVTPGGGPWALNGSSVYYNGGFVGIGTSTPNAPLTFPPTLSHKITLYPGATGDVGMGVAGNRLYLYADNPNADVALGYDAAGTFNERFAFKPNGAMAVMGNAGAAGQVLQSNGGGAAASWANATNLSYNNIYQVISNNAVTITGTSGSVLIPDMTQAFYTGTPAKVITSFSIPIAAPSCGFCGATTCWVAVRLDGGIFMTWQRAVANGGTDVESETIMIPVTAGSHTIDVIEYAGVSGPNAIFGCAGTCILHSVLTLQVIPQ